MIITHYKKPWPHFSITNLLSIENFLKIDEFSRKLNIYDTRSNHQIRDGEIYHLLSNTIQEIADQLGIRTDGLYKCVEFDIIQPGWAYNKIHNDNEHKVLTFVMAISKTGSGTHLFKEKKRDTYKKTTEWIPNGGNGFLRTNKTWHDFDSLTCTEPRRTAILLLTDKEFY